MADEFRPPEQPVQDEAVPLGDLIEAPAGKRAPLRVVEADAPEKPKRKRKPRPFWMPWWLRLGTVARVYRWVIVLAAVTAVIGAGAALLVIPERQVRVPMPVTVPVIVPVTLTPSPTAAPLKPTPTAMFGEGIGRSGYDYLTMADIAPNIPAMTRVRLSVGWFDGQTWHYEVAAEDELRFGEALEWQLAYVPVHNSLTPSATPWPTLTPTPG